MPCVSYCSIIRLCFNQAEFRKKAEDVSLGLKSLRQRNADAQQLRAFIQDRCLSQRFALI